MRVGRVGRSPGGSRAGGGGALSRFKPPRGGGGALRQTGRRQPGGNRDAWRRRTAAARGSPPGRAILHPQGALKQDGERDEGGESKVRASSLRPGARDLLADFGLGRLGEPEWGPARKTAGGGGPGDPARGRRTGGGCRPPAEDGSEDGSEGEISLGKKVRSATEGSRG